MTGDVTTRNKMLKLIPHIDSGNWVVRQAVGTKPVITGKVRGGRLGRQGEGRWGWQLGREAGSGHQACHHRQGGCVCGGGGLGISGRSSFEHLAALVAIYAVALHTDEALILLVFLWGLPARRL